MQKGLKIFTSLINTNFSFRFISESTLPIYSMFSEKRVFYTSINPLNTKRRLLYLKTHFVPHSKHFSSRLQVAQVAGCSQINTADRFI